MHIFFAGSSVQKKRVSKLMNAELIPVYDQENNRPALMLSGQIADVNDGRFKKGTKVFTSQVVGFIEPNKIETKNTVYEIVFEFDFTEDEKVGGTDPD